MSLPRFVPARGRFSHAILLVALWALVVSIVDVPGRAFAAPGDPKPAAVVPVESRPDVVSAALSARAQGLRVEVEALRTETSTTWSNPDGTMTTELHAAPVRFKDQGGGWRDVDLAWRRDRDGTIAPGGHPLGLRLGKRASGAGSVFASATPDSGRQVEWVAPWALPEPALTGATARYADVEPGVDLVVHTRRSGFEWDLVVKRRPVSAPVWRIPLRLKGLTVRPQPDGSILFVDQRGEPYSTIPVPLMWDGAVDERSGEPANVTSMKITVEQTNGDGATLVVAPDPGWFLDPKRVYPITVDPTYANTNAFSSFDTWVQTNYSTDQSASPELKLGTFDGQIRARSFLNFPVAPFKNKQILGATLSLFESDSASCTPSTFVVKSATTASTASRWTSQPDIGSQYGKALAAKGHSGSCPAGRVSVPITGLVQAWSGASYPTGGLVLMAQNESDPNSWKRFHSNEGAGLPYINFTYNRPPGTAAVPSFLSAVSYAPPGGTSHPYTPHRRPWVTSKGTDADGNNVRYVFEFHTSTTPSAATLKATCGSISYPSGTTAGCQPSADLPDNTTIYVRAKTTDGFLDSAWSGWRAVRVAAGTPSPPTVSCPAPHTNGSWTDALPATDVVCTITAAGTGFSAPGYVRATVDGRPAATNFPGGLPGQLKITPSADPNVARTTVTVRRAAGLHTIEAQAESPAGRLSGTTRYSFGHGGAMLSSPAADPRLITTGGIKVAASGPPRGGSPTPTATLKWRVSGYGGDSETVGWNTADGARLTVTDNGAAGVTVSGDWNAPTGLQDEQLDSDPNTAGIQPTVLNDRVPVLLDLQVCLAYSSATQCTWSQAKSTVLRVPHAFGDDFPTADAGPGQVALWTGEFHTDATDVSVPGLSLSRSHSTFAGPTDAVNGVFGPGWTAQLDGSDAGVAGMQVVDNSRVDGTLMFIDDEGKALVYQSPSGVRRTTTNLETGVWVPADEETKQDGAKLTVAGSGAATTIAYTEADGTITTFATTAGTAPTATAAGRFRPVSVTETGVPGKTIHAWDANGRLARITAPAPPGTTCVDAQGAFTNAAGCRSLRTEYGTSGSANGRLTAVWLDIYNPDRNGMDTIKVAAYTYDSAGRLATATDPRSNLGTAYTYDSANRLTSVTPSGEVPFQLNYTAGPNVKLANVKRDRPAGDPAGGTATLASFVYDVPTTGDGLPDLSPASVGRWAQTSVPAKGFAVFGPDHPVVSPTVADWGFAELQYTDAQGYTVNTAQFGAGAWQYTATDYDARGNVVRALDERALRLIIDGQLPAGATADQLATLTVYNADIRNGDTVITAAGTLVTDTYGPARLAARRDGTVEWLRAHTRTEYDQGAPNGGINPATGLPYRLATSETTWAHDPGTGVDMEAVARSLTNYAPPVPGDPDGWALSLPGTVTTDVDLDGGVSTGDISKITRYDAQGRVIEIRQPASNGSDAGTTRTVYYTGAANATIPECGGKPQWDGLVCRTYPAAAPGSGPSLPSTTTTGYSYLHTPTTVVETSGAITRTTRITYLPDGRTASTATTVTGLPGSTPNTRKETEYDPATGNATRVIARNPDGTVTSMVSTGFDGWGRQVSYQPSGDSATTMVYDASGAVATVTDSNGSTRYAYDGVDALGRAERRGLATKVEVRKGGATWTSTGAYDADGSLVTQKLPGGITQQTELDNTGEPVGLRYTGQITTRTEDGSSTVDPNGGWLSWSQDNDIAGRVAREWTPDGAAFTGPVDDEVGNAIPYARAYTYDAAGRLTQVRDRTAATSGVDITNPAETPACVTRSYRFDANHNRIAKVTVPDLADGSCSTTGGTTVSRTFDTADRPITGANGVGSYTYDPLGRTLTLPASDAPKPADGDVTLSYYDNDLAKSIVQGGVTTMFTLDALDRRTTETVTDANGPIQTVLHYTDGSDNPTWVTRGGTSRRYGKLLGGDLSLTIDQAGQADLAIANIHGDVVASVDLPAAGAPATNIGGWNQYDEYGNPAGSNTAGTGEIEYGWLGTKQRALSGAGLTLMGVRLYNPVTGLFTSLDPVPGGGGNSYAYPTDPMNMVDLDGRAWVAAVLLVIIGMIRLVGFICARLRGGCIRALKWLGSRIWRIARTLARWVAKLPRALAKLFKLVAMKMWNLAKWVGRGVRNAAKKVGQFLTGALVGALGGVQTVVGCAKRVYNWRGDAWKIWERAWACVDG